MKTASISRRLCLTAIAGLLVVATGCDFVHHISITKNGYTFTKTGETAQSSEDGTFSEGINQIEIVNQFGNVDIETATANEGSEEIKASWTWDKKVWADTPELAEQYLDDLLMDIQTEGQAQTWKVMLPESSSSFNGMESNLTMRIPEGVAVKVTNAHGNVDIADVKTKVVSKNSHGDSKMANLSGKSVLENRHGDLTANNIGDADVDVHFGDMNIKTAVGDLSADQSHGDVDLGTVEGDLELSVSFGDATVKSAQKSAKLVAKHGDIDAHVIGDFEGGSSFGDIKATTRAENIKLKCQHGGVDLKVENEAYSKIEISASFDTIKLHLPSASSPSIKMKTTFGDTESDFGNSSEIAPGADQKVDLKNQHGDIKVKKF